MENQFHTYLHCRPDGSPFYVGKGNCSRVSHITRDNRHHANTLKKYGKANIKVEVFGGLTETEAYTLEKILIRFYGRADIGSGPLVNHNDGGEGSSGYVFTEEDKKRISDGVRIAYKNPELKSKLRAASKNYWDNPESRMTKSISSRLAWANNPELKISQSARTKGVPKSSEHRKAIGKAHKGRIKSAEEIINIGLASKITQSSPEVKARKSESQLSHWADPEYRARQSASRKAAWARRKSLQGAI